MPGLPIRRRVTPIVLAALLVIATPAAVRAQSVFDGFNPGANGDIFTIAVQPDGKILVGGSFSMLGGGGTGTTPRSFLGRLNPDGSIDSAFDPGANNVVRALAVQADGKILVGGIFTTLGGGGTGTAARHHIGRLNADGSIDATFDPGANGRVGSLVVQPDGRILAAGAFTTLGGGGTGANPRQRLGRLHADGSIDASFSDPGANLDIETIALQTDGKIVAAGLFTALGATARARIARVDANGSLDTGFNPGTSGGSAGVHTLAIQPDGKILVAGDFTGLGGGSGSSTRNRIGRLTAAGAVDATFNPGANGEIFALTLQPDGKILAGGTFSMLGGGTGTTARAAIGRFHADGTLDATFNPGANLRVQALAVQPDGAILAGGLFSTLGIRTRQRIGRLHQDGTVDHDFDPGADGTVTALAIQPDGKIVLGGDFTTAAATLRSNVARLQPDGVIDSTFNPGANGPINAAAIQPDGKILVAGGFSMLGGGGSGTTARNFIGRLNAGGTLDAGFTSSLNGPPIALALQPDGKILVGGLFSGFGASPDNFLRLNANGTVDNTFAGGANDAVHAVAIQPDGKVVVGGVFSLLGGGAGTTSRSRIGRFNADGTLDATFNPGTDGFVYALALQADGRILVGGFFTTLGGAQHINIGRLNANGSIDPTFTPATELLGEVYALAVQADGKILMAGNFQFISGSARNRIARLNANGTVDTSFNPGADNFVSALALQADGKVVAGGGFTGLGGGTGTTVRSHLGRVSQTSAATQTLTHSGASALTWSRGGTGPEVSRVSFELSTDAVTYTSLGSGTRVAGGWQLSGLSLATNQNLFIRARGHHATGQGEGSASIVEAVRNVFVALTSCPTIAPTSLTSATTGAPYSTQFTTTGAVGAITFGVSGTLPAGIGFTAGLLSGTPTQFGTFPLTITATDAGTSCTAQQPVTLTVLPASQTEMIANGGFGSGLNSWNLFATPNMSYMVASVTNGVLEFYRQPPPAGTSNQATAFQLTGAPVSAGTTLVAQFDLANTSTVRKRISVLILEHDFSDLAVCTFWLPASAPMRTYTMRTHSTKAWTNAAIYFYVATTGSNGGAYGLDNVSLQIQASQPADRTACIDPLVTPPAGGGAGPNLLTNGNFSAGQSPWFLFGQITAQITAGVFEFVRPPGTPSGVVLQTTGQTMAAGGLMSASFRLGNSSSVRKRVTVLLHDNDFTDLSACTFWLAPGQPLSDYAMATYATKAWANATLSIYPATVGLDQWIRLDDATLRRTPAAVISGTDCLEPAALPRPAVTSSEELTRQFRPAVLAPSPSGIAPLATVASVSPAPSLAPNLQTTGLREVDAILWHFHLDVPEGASSSSVRISPNGTDWTIVAVVTIPEDSISIDIDLRRFAGQFLFVQVVFHWPIPDL